MSVHSISSQVPRVIEHNTNIDASLQSNEAEEGSCFSTAIKVAALIGSLIACVASFVLMGPVLGLVVTLICGTGLLYLFNSYCGGMHNPSGTLYNNVPVYIPWYQRVFSYVPTTTGPHVPVGQGHIHSPAPRPWYDWFSGTRAMDNGSHVQVGGGHAGQGGHVPVGGGHGTPLQGQGHVSVGGGHGTPLQGQGHVSVGRGHGTPLPGHVPVGGGTGNPATPLPTPSGPTGHVTVGRGHRY